VIDAEKSLISYQLVELQKILESSTTISSLMGSRNKIIICSICKVCVNCMLLAFCFLKSTWETLLWSASFGKQFFDLKTGIVQVMNPVACVSTTCVCDWETRHRVGSPRPLLEGALVPEVLLDTQVSR